jgi:hypothetical protein
MNTNNPLIVSTNPLEDVNDDTGYTLDDLARDIASVSGDDYEYDVYNENEEYFKEE